MDPKKKFAFGWPILAGIGFIAGIVVSAVDNMAFEGEVSPIIIVAMLFIMTTIAGAFWGRRGWFVGIFIWACVPLAHLIKHAIGLPDTLHPNTYLSILKLGAFTCIVSIIGTGCGAILRKIMTIDGRNTHA